jgi:hypothetical protein
MTIDDLIQIASDRVPHAEEIEAAANHAQVTVVRLYDLFAKRVATRYLRGELGYTVGDAAMNGLFGYAYQGGGQEFDRLAWLIYLAFDEGEYLHAGEPAELQGEAITRALLDRVPDLTND